MSQFSEYLDKLLEAQKALDDSIGIIDADTTVANLPDGADSETISDAQDIISRLLRESDRSISGTSSNLIASLEAAESELSDGLDALIAQLDAVGGTEVEDTSLVATLPKQITASGNNEHVRMAIDFNDNIWATWHRTGTADVYVAKYFGECGIWNASGTGGEELRVSNFATYGKRAMFPSIAVSATGEAHVAFQGESAGGWEIYYSHSTGGGQSFTKPIKVTSSDGNAMMPDIAVVNTEQVDVEGSLEKVVIAWHDSRFGNFEIMAAERTSGVWRSSGQDGSDIRITSSIGDSMFPRIASDSQGNIRVVYHDSRRGAGKTGIYMSTFVALSNRWSSSAFGQDDRLVSNSPSDALHPDIAIDHTGGSVVAWHDLRHMEENPDQHEEVYALYCPRMSHPGGVHFPPLQPNVEARLDVDFNIVDCVNFDPISLTNAPEVCLAIRAPGATFWRAANEDGNFTDWQQFRPNFDLETTVVPWTLTCVGGQKKICVQVQDAEMVGFPVCQDVTLALQPAEFRVEFYQDEDMTVPLPEFNGTPVAREGDVFVRLVSDAPQLSEPIFDVISHGQHLIFNQETKTLSISGFSGASSAGIGSFIGTTIDVPREDDVSPVAKAFSAAIGREFAGRFHVKRHDGCFHVDGRARLIPTGKDICGGIRTASDQQTATGTTIVTGDTDEATSVPTFGSEEPPPQPPVTNPPPEDTCPDTFTVSTGKSGTSRPANVGLGGVPAVSGGVPGPYAMGQPFTVEAPCNLGRNFVRLTEIRVQMHTIGATAGRFFVVELHKVSSDATNPITTIQGGGIDPVRADLSLAVLPASGLPTTLSTVTISVPNVAVLVGVKYFVVFRESSSSNSLDVLTDVDGYFRVPFYNDYAPQGSIITGAPRSDFADVNTEVRWPGSAGYSFNMDLVFDTTMP